MGTQDSTRNAISAKSSCMLTTTNDRHDFLTVEDEPENKPGTFDYRDFGLDQKQIGPPVYEAVTSWSDEVAQTQEIGSLPPRQIATNSSPRTHTEKDARLRFSSLEKVVQLLSMSVSPDAVVAVQDQNKYPIICYLLAGDIGLVSAQHAVAGLHRDGSACLSCRQANQSRR